VSRRPAHKLAHATCPYGQSNWAACDKASEHRYGPCKAEVERKGASEPGECSRWAQDEGGYCTQHFIARHETDMRRAREELRQLQLLQTIDAHLAYTAAHPSIWDGEPHLSTAASSTVGLQGVPVTAVRVASPRVEVALPPTAPSNGLPRQRKLPHKLVVRKPPFRVG
jgi:hypothetical protein